MSSFFEVKPIQKGDIIRPRNTDDSHWDSVVKKVSNWNDKVDYEDGRWESISQLRMLQLHGTVKVVKPIQNIVEIKPSMKKRLFLYLLKKFSRDRSSRVEIYKALDTAVSEDYTEQTRYGNVYNCIDECLLGSVFLRELISKKDWVSVEKIIGGINSSVTMTVQGIKSEYFDSHEDDFISNKEQ